MLARKKKVSTIKGVVWDMFHIFVCEEEYLRCMRKDTRG